MTNYELKARDGRRRSGGARATETIKQPKSVKIGLNNGERQQRKRGEVGKRAERRGRGRQCGGLMAGGGQVASNFSLLSSEMTLQI